MPSIVICHLSKSYRNHGTFRVILTRCLLLESRLFFHALHSEEIHTICPVRVSDTVTIAHNLYVANETKHRVTRSKKRERVCKEIPKTVSSLYVFQCQSGHENSRQVRDRYRSVVTQDESDT